MSVKGQGQMQTKILNFTLRQLYVAWKKVSATPLILIKFYRHARKYILQLYQ